LTPATGNPYDPKRSETIRKGRGATNVTFGTLTGRPLADDVVAARKKLTFIVDPIASPLFVEIFDVEIKHPRRVDTPAVVELAAAVTSRLRQEVIRHGH
jgi:hypothetical protein